MFHKDRVLKHKMKHHVKVIVADPVQQGLQSTVFKEYFDQR